MLAQGEDKSGAVSDENVEQRDRKEIQSQDDVKRMQCEVAGQQRTVPRYDLGSGADFSRQRQKEAPRSRWGMRRPIRRMAHTKRRG